MQLLTQTLETKKSLTFPYEEAIICPTGDWHADSQSSDLDRLEKDIKWTSKQKNAYLLGMGDYFDYMPESMRKVLAGFSMEPKFEKTRDLMDEFANRALDMVKDITAPAVGKFLGIINSNHDYVFHDGESLNYKLSQYLQCPYLGTSAFIRIKFRNDRNAGSSVVIFAHHGRTTGNPMKKLEDLSSGIDADIYITAHTHHRQAKVMSQIKMSEDSDKIIHKNKYLISSGGYLKGYMAGTERNGVPQGNYIERAMLKPLPLGAPTITLRPKKVNGYYSTDINVSL